MLAPHCLTQLSPVAERYRAVSMQRSTDRRSILNAAGGTALSSLHFE
jgi:hypothetical protein